MGDSDDAHESEIPPQVHCGPLYTYPPHRNTGFQHGLHSLVISKTDLSLNLGSRVHIPSYQIGRYGTHALLLGEQVESDFHTSSLLITRNSKEHKQLRLEISLVTSHIDALVYFRGNLAFCL